MLDPYNFCTFKSFAILGGMKWIRTWRQPWSYWMDSGVPKIPVHVIEPEFFRPSLFYSQQCWEFNNVCVVNVATAHCGGRILFDAVTTNWLKIEAHASERWLAVRSSKSNFKGGFKHHETSSHSENPQGWRPLASNQLTPDGRLGCARYWYATTFASPQTRSVMGRFFASKWQHDYCE